MATPPTSSFVTDILATAGRLEKDDLNAKLGKLSKRIEEVKVEVYDALHKKYGDFYPHLDAAVDLTKRVDDMSTEVQGLTGKIETEIKAQLSVSATEFQDLSSQLDETNQIIVILEKLMKVNTLLQSADLARESGSFSVATKDLKEAQELLNVPVNKREQEIKVLKSLHKGYGDQVTKLEDQLDEVWKTNIQWNIPQENDNASKKSKKSLIVELCIKAKGDEKYNLQNTVQALQDMERLEPKLQHFGERFIQYIVKPLVTRSGAEFKSTTTNQAVVIKVVDSKGQTDVIEPAKVFPCIQELFSTLHKGFLDQKLKGNKKANTLMQALGNIIGQQFLDIVMQECLLPAIPSSNSELEKFGDVVPHTKTFQKYLWDVKFIDESNKALTDYMGDVNLLYANKKTHEILKKARELMTNDIHNTVKIEETGGEELPPFQNDKKGGKPAAKSIKTAENTKLATASKLSAHTFGFPTCHISVFVRDLVALAYDTLHEATSSSPQSAIQLFYTVRNMFELFCDVMQTYHKESLATLPQFSALHNNNCMYIAHHLLTLGHQFRGRLQNQGAATLVDLVQILRRHGTECFLKQMKSQKSQLVDFLSAAQGFNGVSEDEVYLKAEKAMKQALHQLNRLNQLWKGILPGNIYLKSMGTLLNSVVIEITSSIVILEDISAKDGDQLHALLTIISEKAPELFDLGEEAEKSPIALLHQNTNQWTKFKELILILSASMQDIVDRWADGKGPLAHDYSAKEVKQLIRALFQNTDHRANVLTKIR